MDLVEKILYHTDAGEGRNEKPIKWEFSGPIDPFLENLKPPQMIIL